MSDDVQQETKAPSSVDPETNGHVEEELILDTHQPPMPVSLRHNGVVMKYEIRELVDEDFAWWMKKVTQRIQTGANGKVIRQDYKGIHADLIHLCLYDTSGRRVPKAMIDLWGAKVKQVLFAKCQKQNGMDRGAENEEGKG